MAEITATMVKELRDRTGAGMMDCKKVLDETNGDIEAAVDALRSKGLAAAAKKSSRTAAEGLVGVAVSNGKGVAVEINSETDFVAKNVDFQTLVREVTKVALETGDSVEVLRAADLMSMNRVSIDIGPTRHGITRGGTIYAWDPSGNRFETYSGGNTTYPDLPPIAWSWEGLGEGGGLDVAHRKLHETFLTVVS